MTPRFHFISGLPRSGSTLLSALLRQNPRFHAGITSPVSRLMHELRDRMSEPRENAPLISNAQRQRLLRGIMEGFYGAEDFPQEVIFDTSRQWCALMPLVQELYPRSKVIACVREVGWVVDSLERIAGRPTLATSAIFGFKADGTVYDRVETLAKSTGLVGYAFNAVKEAFFAASPGQLLLLRYETLVSDPQKALDAVYDFIGEPGFAHDSENISFDAETFDQALGTPGLHTVRRKVEAIPRQSVLPPDLFHKFDNDAFWRDPKINPHAVPIV